VPLLAPVDQPAGNWVGGGVRAQCVTQASRDRLSDRRNVTLILRLVLDRLEQLVYGEVVEVDGRRVRRFKTWAQLPGAVQASLPAEDAPREPGAS
jgi:hypothetical protein